MANKASQVTTVGAYDNCVSRGEPCEVYFWFHFSRLTEQLYGFGTVVCDVLASEMPAVIKPVPRVGKHIFCTVVVTYLPLCRMKRSLGGGRSSFARKFLAHDAVLWFAE